MTTALSLVLGILLVLLGVALVLLGVSALAARSASEARAAEHRDSRLAADVERMRLQAQLMESIVPQIVEAIRGWLAVIRPDPPPPS